MRCVNVDYEWEGLTFCSDCFADEMASYERHLERMKKQMVKKKSIIEINKLFFNRGLIE